MAASALDVWFVSAEQVYRGVPFQVAAGWVEQGRLSDKDKVRPTRTNDPWVTVGEHPLLADYLAVSTPPAAAASPVATDAVDLPDPPPPTRPPDDDDDVDMIPLIDVSLVLLVFFLMTTVAPQFGGGVEVPGVRHGAEIRADDPAVITVEMDLRESGEAYYALRAGAGRTLKPEDNNLVTLGELMDRFNALLPQFSTPPEVRIACHKKVKHVRVRELATAIDPYRRRGQISGYRAEVNEQPQ